MVKRTPRIALITGLVLAAVSLAACGVEEPQAPAPARASKAPAGDPAALRRLKADANRLLDGGPAAFKSRLAELRGYPVVVNQWASWCGPCRFEFPFFQRLAAAYEGRVAFLGVDSRDGRRAAAEFLRELPTPFPHYFDKDTSVARLFRGGRAWPTTAFYDRSGRLVGTHIGAYAAEAKLEADIGRYARP